MSHKKQHFIPLLLTESQWCELYSALISKAHSIDNGDYGEDEDDDDAMAAWAEELRRIADVVREQLGVRDITY